ncbi:hypothetical protein HY251_04650 [bacterium]|nr:hypothetical protein [bacterium]
MRVELVETATVATSSTPARESELWVPLASSEPFGQTIESEFITICPDAPYTIASDCHGNRILHVSWSGGAALAVRIKYRVELVARNADLSRIEERPLTPGERGAFAPEIDSHPRSAPNSYDRPSGSLREALEAGDYEQVARRRLPTRSIAGLMVREEAVEARYWGETYVPGIAWLTVLPPDAGCAVGARPESYFAIEKTNGNPFNSGPRCKAGSNSQPSLVTWAVKTLNHR